MADGKRHDGATRTLPPPNPSTGFTMHLSDLYIPKQTYGFCFYQFMISEKALL
ncbi:hypothetical protein [Vreelandella utahensis]|uniref:hypothetical protein n=1 Tax=Vreelandella halophila TaxID=86177 RepID=UPI0015C37083|nr:hypothetical protein [Halomonas utahensis]